MMLKLTEHVGITISLLYKQKTRWNFDIQNFYSKILNFRLFYAKNRNLAQFSGPACLYDVIKHGFLCKAKAVIGDCTPLQSAKAFLRNALADCTHFGMYG